MRAATVLVAFCVWLYPMVNASANKNPVIGSTNAVKGGKFVWGALSYPKSLNYPVSGDGASARIYGLIVETLCEENYRTGEYVPLVAERWEISADKKVFTFHLNKKAKFADGTPVTTKDVKAFWDIVHNPDNIVGAIRASFDKFEKIEIIDAHTLKIHAKSVHFSNLDTICGSFMVTSHKYYLGKGKNFNKSFNSKLFGSGPYVLHSVKKGKRVVLKRNKDYWGAHLPQNIGRFNFDTFVYRSVNDHSVRYELFKKGEIDMIDYNVAKRWKTETSSEKFEKNWIIAHRMDNKEPQGFSGVIINTRRKPFDDVRVRKALAYTYHREKFIKDLFFNSYDRLASYWPASIFANSGNVMIDFDLAKARQLLKEAGFTKTNSKGVLLGKDGKPFVAEYFYTSKASERHLTIWKEDLRKVGIDLQLNQTTWATLVKKWDKYEFSLAGVAWGAGLNPDPYEMWHSKFKDQPSGNNLAGFIDPRLDELIMKIGPIFDRSKRAKLFHEMDGILFNNHPYILGWSLSYQRVGYWNKFSFIPEYVPLYASSYGIWQYAWYDAAKHAALKAAMQANKALPAIAGIKGPQS